MVVTHRAVIGLVIVMLDSIAAGQPAYAQNGSSDNFGSSATASGGGVQQAQGYGRAPIGHRQPRPGDIPADAALSPSDRALRQEDDRVDNKLVICRGC
jgi:hypothetical protein